MAYAVCYLQSESEQAGLCVRVGSDDPAKIYLNGKETYCYAGGRKCVPDQDEVPRVELKAGLNVLVFKVVNETRNWQGSVRFTDAAGQPFEGTKVQITP